MEKSCEIPADKIVTGKGSMNIIEVQIKERGTYLLEAEVRSELDNALAQIPMSVSIGSHAIETVSLSGAENEWKKIAVELPSVMSFTFYLKIFYALGGMGIRNIRLRHGDPQYQALAPAVPGGRCGGSPLRKTD